MNRERAKELLPVIQAFAEGKTVQCYGADGWYSSSQFNFDDDTEYRIKPEPRVFWLIEHQDGSISFQSDVAPIGASKFIEDLSDEC